MRKFLCSRIFSFILGAVIFGGISVVSAYTLFASDTVYTPRDETWEVNNVKSALDDLKGKIDITLLWENQSPKSAFGGQTINLNLSDYKTVLVETLSCFGADLDDGRPNAINVVTVGNTSGLADAGSGDMRSISVTTSSITFGNAKYAQWDDNGCVIPYKVYGMKKIMLPTE